MKNIDLGSFVGMNANDLLKKADELFNINLEGKMKFSIIINILNFDK